MNSTTRPALWTCPRCGHRFVSRNMWHSCARHAIREHFEGKDPALLRLFRAYRRFVRSAGPVHVYAQKTRIVFQTRARFTGVLVRQRWLEVAFWLKRKVDDPRFHRIELIPKTNWIHYLRLREAGQLDEGLRAILLESYRVGKQEIAP